jgi:ribosomal protein L10
VSVVETQIFCLIEAKIMPKTRKQKEHSVQTLDEKLSQSKSLVFANFSGLKVKDATKLRT